MAAHQTTFRKITEQVRIKTLRLGMLTLLTLGSTLATQAAAQEQGRLATYGTYQLPSAHRPALRQGAPLSIPIKALVERVAMGPSQQLAGQRRFRYDIDTLGHGMNLRMQLRF